MMKSSTTWLLVPILLAPALALAADPVLSVTEPGLGSWDFEGLAASPVVLEVTENAELNFGWLGDASGYGGTIQGYRFGWDLTDPDDPLDPGWTTAGYELDLLAAPPRSFAGGVHTLHVACADDAGGLSRAWFRLEIVPTVPATRTGWGAVKEAFRR
jgi:hypothetical protein